MVDLGGLGGFDTSAIGINDSGLIVGLARAASVKVVYEGDARSSSRGVQVVVGVGVTSRGLGVCGRDG